MPLFNLTDFLASLAPGARLMGLDPGARRIGVALSDVNRRMASPYGTLARLRLKINAEEIKAIIAKERVGGLVIGLPLGMDGTFNPAAQAARDWGHAVAAATSLPTYMQDESSSTADTHEMLIGQMDMGRIRRGAIIDKMAAANILQSALAAFEKAQKKAAELRAASAEIQEKTIP